MSTLQRVCAVIERTIRALKGAADLADMQMRERPGGVEEVRLYARLAVLEDVHQVADGHVAHRVPPLHRRRDARGRRVQDLQQVRCVFTYVTYSSHVNVAIASFPSETAFENNMSLLKESGKTGNFIKLYNTY